MTIVKLWAPVAVKAVAGALAFGVTLVSFAMIALIIVGVVG